MLCFYVSRKKAATNFIKMHGIVCWWPCAASRTKSQTMHLLIFLLDRSKRNLIKPLIVVLPMSYYYVPAKRVLRSDKHMAQLKTNNKYFDNSTRVKCRVYWDEFKFSTIGTLWKTSDSHWIWFIDFLLLNFFPWAKPKKLYRCAMLCFTLLLKSNIRLMYHDPLNAYMNWIRSHDNGWFSWFDRLKFYEKAWHCLFIAVRSIRKTHSQNDVFAHIPFDRSRHDLIGPLTVRGTQCHEKCHFTNFNVFH